jgi:hypothetical protein
VARNGWDGFSGDNGPATSALIGDDFFGGVAVDHTGNLYIADSQSNRVREVSNGVITTVAKNGARSFFNAANGDNVAAVSVPIILAVATDEGGWSEIDPYIARHRLTYPVGLLYDVKRQPYSSPLPYLLIIDRSCRIAASHVGQPDDIEESVRHLNGKAIVVSSPAGFSNAIATIQRALSH